MNCAPNVRHLDRQPMQLCPLCLEKLHVATHADLVWRYQALRELFLGPCAGLVQQAEWIACRLQAFGIMVADAGASSPPVRARQQHPRDTKQVGSHRGGDSVPSIARSNPLAAGSGARRLVTAMQDKALADASASGLDIAKSPSRDHSSGVGAGAGTGAGAGATRGLAAPRTDVGRGVVVSPHALGPASHAHTDVAAKSMRWATTTPVIEGFMASLPGFPPDRPSGGLRHTSSLPNLGPRAQPHGSVSNDLCDASSRVCSQAVPCPGCVAPSPCWPSLFRSR